MAYIQFIDISKSYGDNKVLKNINLSIEKNEFVTLLGSSGCGKTTLLRILAGFESIDSGKIVLDGEDITNKNPRDRNIGMIFQSYCLFPTMNVFNNVAYGLRFKKIDKKTIEKEVFSALESVNLQDKAKSYPSQLSGGQQQRVALARSIVMKPKVLLLDEPFNAIDAKLRKSLQIKVKEIHEEYGMTSIMVTHDQDEAMIMSDTIHLVKNGNIEQSGTSTELYLYPRTKYVASFMGNYNVLEPKVFSKMTLGKYTDTKTVVLRPEAIEIQSEKCGKIEKDLYQFEGIIQDYIPQGNIVRFIILVEDTKLNVDTLVDNLTYFSIGQKVYLDVDLEKVLYYD